MRKQLLIQITIVLIILLAATVTAEIPKLISYQGRLLDETGDPVTGSHNFTFALYMFEEAPLGDSIWTETHSLTLEDDGVYNVMLGSVTPFPSNVDFSSQYWLGLFVDGDEIARYALTADPYSFRADVADSLSGGCVGDTLIAYWEMLRNIPPDIADGDDNTAGVSGDGTADYLARWVNSDSLTASGLYDNGSDNFGMGAIGLVNARLYIDGGDIMKYGIYSTEASSYPIYAEWDGSSAGAAVRATNSGTGGDALQAVAEGSGRSAIYARGSSGVDYSIYSNANGATWAGYFTGDIAITGDANISGNLSVSGNFPTDDDWNTISDTNIYSAVSGNVGIGTPSPNAKLHINGGATIPPIRAQVDGHSRFILSTNGGVSIGDYQDTPPERGLYVYGNLGIGTASPAADLHIVSDDTLASLIVAPTASSSGDHAELLLAEDNDATFGMLWRYNGDDNVLNLYGKNTSTYYGPHLSINRDNGNVGIGTDDPDEALEVVGDIKANGINSRSLILALESLSDIELTLESGGNVGGAFFQIFHDGDYIFAVYEDGKIFATNDMEISGGTGSVNLLVEADTDNSGEGNQPSITLSQDGGDVQAEFGYFHSDNHLTLANRYSAGHLLLGAGDTTIMELTDNHRVYFYNEAGETAVKILPTEGSDGSQISLYKADGTESITLDADYGGLGGDGRIQTEELQITGGSDIAEPFDIDDKYEIKEGMVVRINPQNPGKLSIADQAYDRMVAGVISGAGEVKPGMIMGQKGTIANGEYPIALTGRVYVLADASYGAINPGALLTSSNTPGHAMKVADHSKATGAIIGKAMTSLDEGQGLVLILVTLQ